MVKINKTQIKKKRLITAALPYINNIPHLGHIVGSHLPADIFARYSRLKGYDTIFVGGTDEHGSASEITAEGLGVDIDIYSDKMHEEHAKIYNWFNISYDNFSRTSSQIHHETVREFFKVLDANGFIEEGEMDVFYSVKDDRFLPDRYIKGRCPKCNYEDANGDQCEKCTSVLESSALINPRSTISGEAVEARKTKHLFLRLDKIAPQLEYWINSQKHWRKTVSGIAKGWIKEGLRKRAITRDLKHGVNVPISGYEDKVFYVWFDAPIGYISSTKEIRSDWESIWKGDNSEIFNFLGKDNIPFHTIFWPSMLIGHGGMNLPKNIIGLQYLNYEKEKFSKSKNIGVFCENLPQLNIPADAWRAYLTQIIPETNDSEFKWAQFQERVNSDLIGNFSNYINRSMSFIFSRLNGKIYRPSKNQLTEKDKIFLNILEEKVEKISNDLELCKIRDAFSEILALSSEGNKYMTELEPWKLVKDDSERANTVMYLNANLGRSLAILSSPFIPSASKKIWKTLNLKGNPDEPGRWETAKQISLPKSLTVNKPEKLFSPIEDKDLKYLKQQVSKSTDLKKLFKKN